MIYRRKFGSQISGSIWADQEAEVGRAREEKRRGQKIREEKKSEKKIKVHEKAEKSGCPMF